MKTLVVGEGEHEQAALAVLVERISSRPLQCDFDFISSPHLHAHHGKGQGFVKRAVHWCLEAQKRGYEALVLLADHDGRDERIREMNIAQELDLGVSRRAMGIAIRTFDAWMLADERALSKVLGCSVSRQPDVETISDPKGRCAGFLESVGGQVSQRHFYAKLAHAMDLRVLEDRSSRGFAPFARRIREL